MPSKPVTVISISRSLASATFFIRSMSNPTISPPCLNSKGLYGKDVHTVSLPLLITLAPLSVVCVSVAHAPVARTRADAAARGNTVRSRVMLVTLGVQAPVVVHECATNAETSSKHRSRSAVGRSHQGQRHEVGPRVLDVAAAERGEPRAGPRQGVGTDR